MMTISVVTPCYNEEGNVAAMYESVKAVFAALPHYDYEHIFIDNRSTDATASVLAGIAKRDRRVKCIFNTRNFGPGRSGGYALLQAKGDAVIGLACDFQDPPELIPRFLEMWEKGYKVVFGQKTNSEESRIMFGLRTLYYKIIDSISEVDQFEHVTGFGLYDRSVIDILRWMEDPNPFLRGAIAELGYEVAFVPYVQPKRRSGKSSYNVFRYFDTALTSMTNSSRTPLRIAIYVGFFMSVVSFLIAVAYLVIKLRRWDDFHLGLAPILIGIFFLGSVQLAVTGIIGEYIGAVLNRVTKRPLVVERERVNFGEDEAKEGRGEK